jgi:glycosyltransferase involved in cell wall biosynthesis
MAMAARVGAPSVLQVVLTLNPGGTERLVLEIVRRLRDEFPMAVCCLDEEGAWGAQLRNEQIEVTTLHRTPGFRPGLGHRIARFAARHQTRVVHCHQYSAFVYGSLARLWNPGLQIIFTEHGRLSDAPPSTKRRAANRLLALAPREVYAVSSDLKAHLVAEGFRGAHVGVIHNGIDVGLVPDARARLAIRDEMGVTEDHFLVATIARLDPVKDLATLIRATAALGARTPATLLVIGDGPERRALEDVVVHLGAESCVRFLGHRDDARRWLAGCDAYANSSISEGISLTILEAMAAGLPVVATDVGGTSEVVDRSCGRLVPPRNPGALTDALAELALDADLRRALGHASRQRVEAHFTLDRMVGEYRAAYLRAAS